MVARRKGLSLEEKRAKMLELFYETQEFYQMKELEKIIGIVPKKKGVISQSVKEVTQSLVDDGLVECEKIGTFVCYWAFPSKVLQVKKRLVENLEASIRDLDAKVKKAKWEVQNQRKEKVDCKTHTGLITIITKLEEKEKDLRKLLDKYALCNLEVINQVRSRIRKASEDANRWTDNIFTIKKWCKSKFAMDEQHLDKQFEIPEVLNYFE
ncbi:unnamed protein product [Strongylus vulgaris]|uniref:Meiotic nuclear division protein 1 homolog n=1 Tax=Strongylus vulgaris TaxID=40348 RepID=A0A3P7IXZ3_STRVU|nr:unnamed protein product [Strongylus vulgaris]